MKETIFYMMTIEDKTGDEDNSTVIFGLDKDAMQESFNEDVKEFSKKYDADFFEIYVTEISEISLQLSSIDYLHGIDLSFPDGDKNFRVKLDNNEFEKLFSFVSECEFGTFGDFVKAVEALGGNIENVILN